MDKIKKIVKPDKIATNTKQYQYPKDKGFFKLKITAEELKSATETYLQQCEDEKRTPLLVEFVFNLGITRQTHWRYKKKPGYKQYFDLVEEAEQKALLKTVSDGSRPIGSMFLLKAKHGYIEAQKLDITTNGESLGVVMLPGKPNK